MLHVVSPCRVFLFRVMACSWDESFFSKMGGNCILRMHTTAVSGYRAASRVEVCIDLLRLVVHLLHEDRVDVAI